MLPSSGEVKRPGPADVACPIHSRSCIWSSNAYEGFHAHPQLTSKSQAPIWYEGSPVPDHWLAPPMRPFVTKYTRNYVLIQVSCVYGALYLFARIAPTGPWAKPGDKLEARVEKRKLVLRRIQSIKELRGSLTHTPKPRYRHK